MEPIDLIADRLFPHSSESLNQVDEMCPEQWLLRTDYETRIREGESPDQAAWNALLSYHTENKTTAQISYAMLRRAYQSFRRKYPWLIRGSLLGMFVLTFLLMVVFVQSASTLTILNWWVAGMILLLCFMVLMEYIDYRFLKVLCLNQVESQVPTKEENEEELQSRQEVQDPDADNPAEKRHQKAGCQPSWETDVESQLGVELQRSSGINADLSLVAEDETDREQKSKLSEPKLPEEDQQQ